MQDFVVGGITSNKSWSNWVFFFFPTKMVMVNLGLKPSIFAGIKFGAGVQNILLAAVLENQVGPKAENYKDLGTWCFQLRSKAKKVMDISDENISEIHFYFNMGTYKLGIIFTDSNIQKFTLMNRTEAYEAVPLLRERFGEKFKTFTTPTYRFFYRYAPFLVN